MQLTVVFLGILLLVAAGLAVCSVAGRRLRSALALVLALFVALGACWLWLEFNRHPWTWYIESVVRPWSEHVTYGLPDAGLPLPSGSAFVARYSHTVAAYYSRHTPQGVRDFYVDLARGSQVRIDDEGGSMSLFIAYEGIDYRVTVEAYGDRSSRIIVETLVDEDW